VPKKSKKEGRENLKTEKFRNKYRLSRAWQTIPDGTVYKKSPKKE